MVTWILVPAEESSRMMVGIADTFASSSLKCSAQLTDIFLYRLLS